MQREVLSGNSNSVTGRPTNLDKSRTKAYCDCSRCEWELFGFFCLSTIVVPSLTISLEHVSILGEVVFHRVVKPKPINQPSFKIIIVVIRLYLVFFNLFISDGFKIPRTVNIWLKYPSGAGGH